MQACNEKIAFVRFDVRLDGVKRQATRRSTIGSSTPKGRLQFWFLLLFVIVFVEKLAFLYYRHLH